MKFSLLYLIFFFLGVSAKSFSCECDFVFDDTPKKTIFIDGNVLGVEPGNTVCIKGGEYDHIRIINLQGSEDHPIQISNCNGIVKVNVSRSNQHGIIVNNSTHYNISGLGDPEFLYGIEILGNPNDPQKTGIAMGGFISDLSVHHIKIHDVELGLHLVNIPTCDSDSWAENWTMKNVDIHNLRVYNTKKEGLYIGSSKYGIGYKAKCEGEIKLLMPPLIENIKVHHNRIENTGWDSFQVSTAIKYCEINNNVCRNFGIEDKPAQRAGIVLGGGSSGLIYNNLIEKGKGDAIDCFGIGNVKIFNNIIFDTKRQGIFIGNRPLFKDDYNYEIVHNTIIDCGEDGIRYNNALAKNSIIQNNVLINSGNHHINIVKKSSSGISVKSNIELNGRDTKTFPEGIVNFVLATSSELINKGVQLNKKIYQKDFFGSQRGQNPEPGAIKYSPDFNRLPLFDGYKLVLKLKNNQSFSYQIPKDRFSDPDGDQLTFELKTPNDLDWINYNHLKNEIEGIVPMNAKGSFFINVVCRDENDSTIEVDLIIFIENEMIPSNNTNNDKTGDQSILEIQPAEIQPLLEDSVNIYPNPVLKFLLVQIENTDWFSSQVQVLDSNKKLIESSQLKKGKLWVDCSEFSAGKYFLKISEGGYTVVKEFEKK